MKEKLDGVLLADDEEVKAAMFLIWERMKIVFLHFPPLFSFSLTLHIHIFFFSSLDRGAEWSDRSGGGDE